MSAILKSGQGQIVAVKTGSETGQILVSIPGMPSGSAIYTSFRMSEKASYQTVPTIGGPRYIYSFGQELSEIQIEVMTFTDTCDSGGEGLTDVLEFYRRNRLSASKAEPISLTFAGRTIKAFLVGMSTDASAQNGLSLVRVSLNLIGWVDSATVGGGAGFGGLLDTISSAISGAASGWMPSGGRSGFGMGSAMSTLSSVFGDAA